MWNHKGVWINNKFATQCVANYGNVAFTKKL